MVSCCVPWVSPDGCNINRFISYLTHLSSSDRIHQHIMKREREREREREIPSHRFPKYAYLPYHHAPSMRLTLRSAIFFSSQYVA